MTIRGVLIFFSVGLAATLFWLDQNRGGPASMLSRCNLLLSRSEMPPADILIVGSSRTGTAIDPVAMQKMLTHASSRDLSVERIALGHNPQRATHALLKNYLETRGSPQVIVLEIMFMTTRSLDRLARRSGGMAPEHYIFRRDVNLLTFAQLLTQPAVAMPYTESENWFNQWRFRLRGATLRAGALTYQFLRHPMDRWKLSDCGPAEWTREPTWPAGFAFSYDDYEPNAPLAELIESLEAEIAKLAAQRELKPWQVRDTESERYPYDFEEPYRQGEVVLLEATLQFASDNGARIVLLPLPLYGHAPDPNDLRVLASTLPDGSYILDVYGQIRHDFDKFWYDDAHVEVYPTGTLTTALLAQYLVDANLLNADEAERLHD